MMKTVRFIFLVAVTICGVSATFAQTWTQTSAPSSIGWLAVASSADGNKLFAVSIAGAPPIYGLSTNAGATWTTNVQPRLSTTGQLVSWTCIASSADGNTLIAMNGNGVWVSTNAGSSWLSNNVPGVSFWASVALSADGTRAVAVDGNPAAGGGGVAGGIYTSTNSGVTWIKTPAPTELWSSVASSTDGSVLAATAQGYSPPAIPVYISTNAGLTWAPTPTPTNMDGAAIACSADGHKLIVGGYDVTAASWTGMLYTSTNLGNTWISNGIVSAGLHWYGVASSADGTTLIACSEGYPFMFTSTNSGATWISNNVPISSWTGVASSADGTKLVATEAGFGAGGVIYASQTTPSPQLQLTLPGLNPTLAWTIPSTNFILQQSSDLTSANWSNVTNTPVLDYTNLQYQVALPMSVGNAFFRLKTP